MQLSIMMGLAVLLLGSVADCWVRVYYYLCLSFAEGAAVPFLLGVHAFCSKVELVLSTLTVNVNKMGVVKTTGRWIIAGKEHKLCSLE